MKLKHLLPTLALLFSVVSPLNGEQTLPSLDKSTDEQSAYHDHPQSWYKSNKKTSLSSHRDQREDRYMVFIAKATLDFRR